MRINNLKIGDEIEIEFDYEKVSTRYKSREMDKYTYKKLAKGILKIDENGGLYAESIDNMIFYDYVKEGRK